MKFSVIFCKSKIIYTPLLSSFKSNGLVTVRDVVDVVVDVVDVVVDVVVVVGGTQGRVDSKIMQVVYNNIPWY